MKLNYLRTPLYTYTTYCSFLFIISVFICSCAQQARPSGGLLDKTPPKALRYHPDSAATNFNSKSIEITFDEFIQLQDLNTQLLISPPLEYQPDITVKKKTLSIVFDKKEVLKPNSTYTLRFGKALRDLHESTPLEDFKYIFSTGSYIDSLSLEGNVLYAFDHKTDKDVRVMLYTDVNDSAIYKKQPEYFDKTNDAGFFKITNVRPGKYKIVAVKDQNNNYKYDEGEVVGFIDTLVEAGQNASLSIPLFKEESKKIFLKKKQQEQYGKFSFIFSQGVDSLRMNILNHDQFKDVKQLLQYSKLKDSLTLWIDYLDKDSLVLQFLNGNTVLDTVKFSKLIKKEIGLKSSRSPLKLTLKNPVTGAVDLNTSLTFAFSHPLVKIDTTIPVLLKEDTLAYKKYPLVYKKTDSLFAPVILTSTQKPELKKTSRNPLLKENTNYSLLIPSGTFTDFFGLKNDTIKLNWKTKEEKFYGTLQLKVNFDPLLGGDYIIQLLDDKETIVRQNIISSAEIIYYDFLFPQTYKLKVIFDKNKNGRWDTGDYLKKIHAEKTLYNKEAIMIRSNWDLELEWTITEPK